MTSLQQLLKKRIIVDMIRSVQPAGKWKIVIVDSTALRIMNSACKIYDVLEENVTLVENLNRQRQSYPHLDAIYFLAPTLESVHLLIEDGSKKPPTYLAGHVFFTSALSDNLFDLIKKSPATGYIKQLKELFVDFISFESNCFTLEKPLSLKLAYSPNFKSQWQTDSITIAKQFVSVLATLGEYPNIRHSSTPIAQQVAMGIQMELDELCRLDSDFPPPSPYPRATVVVVDRSIDVLECLIHEFTYQAMANDLLIVDGYKYNWSDVNGLQQVVLDESDQIWQNVRHKHIAETINSVIQEFNGFMNNNAAAQSYGKKEAGSLKEMKATLQALPQFQDLKKKFSAHIGLCQECMSLFEKKKLAQIAGMEQDLVNASRADGTLITNRQAMVELVTLLDDAQISNQDKLRLLMIYCIVNDGISDDERRKLINLARLSPEESNALTNLSFLGVKLSPGSSIALRRWYKGNVDAMRREARRKAKQEEELPYELSRYTPTLKYIMQDVVGNVLDSTRFPYTKELPPDVVQDDPKVSNKIVLMEGDKSGLMARQVGMTSADISSGKLISLRTTKATWAKKTPESIKPVEEGSFLKKKEVDVRKNGRIIVFVVGGLTFGELRSCYEVAEEEKREIIVGTTDLLTPGKFVEQLIGLKDVLQEGNVRGAIGGGVVGQGLYVTPPTGEFGSMSLSVDKAKELAGSQPSPNRSPGGTSVGGGAVGSSSSGGISPVSASGEKKKGSFLKKLKDFV